MPKERPILFSGPMVRAILEGRKTQTRRLTRKPRVYPTSVYEGIIDGYHQWYESRGGLVYCRKCPFGVPGDRLWVRETWTAVDDDYQGSGDTCSNAEILYHADGRTLWRNIPEARRPEWFAKLTPLITRTSRLWRPSIFMPKFAARIWLEITDVRVERLQDISEADARAEGCPPGKTFPIAWFNFLWDSLNTKRGYGWTENPWVWALTLST